MIHEPQTKEIPLLLEMFLVFCLSVIFAVVVFFSVFIHFDNPWDENIKWAWWVQTGSGLVNLAINFSQVVIIIIQVLLTLGLFTVAVVSPWTLAYDRKKKRR